MHAFADGDDVHDLQVAEIGFGGDAEEIAVIMENRKSKVFKS